MSKNLTRFVFGERPDFGQSLEQFSSLAAAESMVLLLENDVEVFFVFEGLVDLDYLRVVEGRQHNEFFQNIPWVFDILFFDAFDSSYRMGVILHPAPVDDSERSTSHHLLPIISTSSRS